MAKKKNHDTQQPHPPVTEQTTSPAEETTPEEVTDAAENTGAQTELEALQAEMAAQKDQFLRMAAEYDNYRKRTEKEKLATYDNAVAASVEAFLPVIDNFALALDAGQNMPDEFRKGLELIQKKFDGALEKLHVSTFAERGDEFNPELHNAISRVTDPEIEEDHIASVYQKGFRIGDKIIRHAMVQVSDGQ